MKIVYMITTIIAILAAGYALKETIEDWKKGNFNLFIKIVLCGLFTLLAGAIILLIYATTLA